MRPRSPPRPHCSPQPRCSGPAAAETVVVGSKRFTESYILGEILREAAARTGAQAEYKAGLGNTGIVFAALKSGAIDVYPEYTGTIAREILNLDGNLSLAEIDRRLAPMGFGAGVPLGFNNTYALAMRDEQAAKLGIRTLSDLARHPGLKLGLSQEFIGRADGWPGLKRAYGLPYETPSGLDHGLAYEAIAAGRIDVMDIYSTDAKIERYALRVLADDQGYFPNYDAVLLYRRDLPQRAPHAWQALAALEGKIDERRMIRLNAAAELEGRTFQQAAASFFDGGTRHRGAEARRARRDRRTGSLAAYARASAARRRVARAGDRHRRPARRPARSRCAARGSRSSPPVGVIQTVPSLALLAFLIAAARPHRHAAGAGRALPVRAAADRAQHPRRPRGYPRRHAPGGARARALGARPPAARSSCRSPRRRSSPA